MTEKTYYIQNSLALNTAIKNIKKTIVCYLNREFIEMDYSKITITTRTCNIAYVETVLAPLM